MKEEIIVSFSGGRTSAYMCYWLKENMRHLYDLNFVYANTGLEHEKTLEFINKVDKYLNLNLVWIEAKVIHEKNKGTLHTIVNFETASRKGEPFEQVIKKYGLPSHGYMHCTRELKVQAIRSWQKSIGLKDARNAVGIRYDEFNRVTNEKNIIYPLATIGKLDKEFILSWWRDQPFDLEISERYGNCVSCYKKGDLKLNLVADENPQYFDFFIDMERKYPDNTRRIYRGYRTASEMQSKQTVNENNLDLCSEECGTMLCKFEENDEFNLFDF